MPRDVLDYAQPHAKTVPAPARPVPLRRSRWFVITSRALALSLAAAPIGALTIPLLDHPYGLVGAAMFAGAGVFLLHLFRRVRPWRLLVVAAVAALAVTAALHFASINTFVIENASGQTIARISFHPIHRNYSFEFQGVPHGAVLRFHVHDLFYDGLGNVAGGELADGTPLHSATFQIGSTRYRRTTKISAEPSGRVDVAWP